MTRLRPPRRPEPVPAPRAALARRGWRTLTAERPEPGPFASLLAELRAGGDAHTWRWLAPGGGLAELERAEARLRPGVLYGYYAAGPGGRELVAAAAVAERVRRGFPHPGWPVVARGYVRRRWRGDGLYAALLAHRVRVCRRAWGRGLEAVHLGSANPRVWRAALAGAGGMRFVPIGRERIGDGARRRTVRAFAAFAPAYARRLRAESAGDPRLSALVARLLAGRFGPHDHVRLARARGLARGRRPALGRFLDLCAAIPLS